MYGVCVAFPWRGKRKQALNDTKLRVVGLNVGNALNLLLPPQDEMSRFPLAALRPPHQAVHSSWWGPAFLNFSECYHFFIHISDSSALQTLVIGEKLSMTEGALMRESGEGALNAAHRPAENNH